LLLSSLLHAFQLFLGRRGPCGVVNEVVVVLFAKKKHQSNATANSPSEIFKIVLTRSELISHGILGVRHGSTGKCAGKRSNTTKNRKKKKGKAALTKAETDVPCARTHTSLHPFK
jgi:hypothetical protein